MIKGQKWNVILEILWLIHHNPEIDWKTEKMKMTRYSEKIWEVVEMKARKIGVVKTKERRKNSKGRK